MPDFAYDVFLSHSRDQKDWTRDLARRLRDEGFEVWFDEWCLRGGENWIVGLRRGVNESRHVVFVVSPEWMEAVWPLFEVYLSIFRDPGADDRKLIPIIHTRCHLPEEIGGFRHCPDFSETHGNPLLYEFKLAQLMAALEPSREGPTDFELWVAQYEGEQWEVIPPVRPLPPKSMMPLRPNPHFVGREDELRQLERHLRAGSTTAIGQVAAATGLGGIGKTQLAVEYVHRYGPRYRGGVCWLDMENEEVIPSQVARCGGPEGMDLPGFETLPLEEQVARVKKEWEKAVPRLLIFDNVDSADLVNEWRPVSGGCRVLITSRRTRWPSTLGLAEVNLATLPRDKAMELLCKGRPEALEDEEEAKAASAICDALGDLPLALALAGAYLESQEHDVTLSQYLEQLRQQPVLENPALVDFVQDPSPTGHVQSVGATFEASYGSLDPEDETDLLAMRLFHLASHFAPVSIRRDLLLASAGLDPQEGNEQRLAGEALGRLLRLGLVQVEPGGRLVLHRLLDEFAGALPAPGQSEGEAWEDVAQVMLDFAREENQRGLPATLARELGHLSHLAAQAHKRGWGQAGELFNELGYHQRMVGSYGEARESYGRALEIDEAAHGPDHPMVATAVNNLGSVLQDLGDLEGARRNFERALEIDEAAHGPDHPMVATAVNNLGRVLHDLGDLGGARDSFERALGIDEEAYGPDHPKVAAAVNNLGLALRDLGDLEGARLNIERALAVWEASLGSQHPQVAAALGNLGIVLQDMGRVEEALAHLERALVIDLEFFGHDHPKTATDLRRLGGAYRAMGRLDAARNYLERALSVDIGSLGPDHPDVARDHFDLGSLLRETGDLAEAGTHLQTALYLWGRAPGAVHPEVAIAARVLGDVLQMSGDLPAAQAQYEHALAIHGGSYGPDHEAVAMDLNSLGGVLMAAGDAAGALELYQRALGILNRIGAENTPVARVVVDNISAVRELDSGKT